MHITLRSIHIKLEGLGWPKLLYLSEADFTKVAACLPVSHVIYDHEGPYVRVLHTIARPRRLEGDYSHILDWSDRDLAEELLAP